MAKPKKKIKLKKNRVRSLIYMVLGMVMITLSIYFTVIIIKVVAETVVLRNTYEEAEALLAEMEAENERLSTQVERLSDPEYIKSYARGEYSLSKQGEQIFKLPAKNDDE